MTEPDYPVFLTNYDSPRGREPAARSPAAESDACFAGRAWRSRLAACASRQAERTPGRDPAVAMRPGIKEVRMETIMEMQWTCPACWEQVTSLVDRSLGEEPFYEDCPVCCHPARLKIVEREVGREQLVAEAAS